MSSEIGLRLRTPLEVLKIIERKMIENQLLLSVTIKRMEEETKNENK